jgi:hypothetical protein
MVPVYYPIINHLHDRLKGGRGESNQQFTSLNESDDFPHNQNNCRNKKSPIFFRSNFKKPKSVRVAAASPIPMEMPSKFAHYFIFISRNENVLKQFIRI